MLQTLFWLFFSIASFNRKSNNVSCNNNIKQQQTTANSTTNNNKQQQTTTNNSINKSIATTKSVSYMNLKIDFNCNFLHVLYKVLNTSDNCHSLRPKLFVICKFKNIRFLNLQIKKSTNFYGKIKYFKIFIVCTIEV